MTLADTMNGPGWILWVVAAIFAVISGILLSGHGSKMISGYNQLSAADKAKYNEKRLCRVVGAGLALITLVIILMGALQNILPAYFAYILGGIVVFVVIADLIAIRLFCMNKN